MIAIYADLETTGFDPGHGAEITEVGLIKADSYRPFDIYFGFFDIVSPTIHSEVVQSTGITREMLKGFPLISTRRDAIKAFIGKYPIIGYNAPFDAKFMVANGLIETTHPVLDLYPWVREMRLPIPNNKLQTVLKHYQLTPTFAHRALSDAFSLLNLVARLRWAERIDKAIK